MDSFLLFLIIGVLSGCSSLEQVKYCSYLEIPNNDVGTVIGGRITTFENGTIKCVIDDPKEILSCMATFRVENVTDHYGNSTEQVVVKGKGCLPVRNDSESTCNTDGKCSTRRKKSGSAMEFCCCLTDHCNMNEKITFLAPLEDELNVDENPQTDPLTSYLIPSGVGVLSLGILIVVFFYIYRKRQLEKHLVIQQMKVHQYNYEVHIHNSEPPLVNYDDLRLDSCLHRGRFGDVYKAKLNDHDVCVKYFHSQQRSLFYNERDIYSVLDPSVKSVVQCFACDEKNHSNSDIQYIVIMEYVPFGSLAAYLKSHTISAKELCNLGQSAASGLGYLHSETYSNGVHKAAIVHRDINSRNILVRADLTCTLADMGFAMKIRGSKIIRNGVEEHAEDGSLRDVGTVRYMAPEILDCAVNLKDCESSLKQIDIYAFSLVLWELLTRCRDLLFEKGVEQSKRFMLPFEEELGAHPDFEKMRLFVAKEQRRPVVPINLRKTEATDLLKDTIEECWDTDAEARLTALCVAERFKDIHFMLEKKAEPVFSKNLVCEKIELIDLQNMENQELSPLIEQDTPASEDGRDFAKLDVNIELDRKRQVASKQGRNLVNERNMCYLSDEEELAVHENELMTLHQAMALKGAVAEDNIITNRVAPQPCINSIGQRPHTSRQPQRGIQLNIHNQVHDRHRMKENNLNRRRHNSQHNLNESSTSSNGTGDFVTIPDHCRSLRPKSLNLNIKPEGCPP